MRTYPPPSTGSSRCASCLETKEGTTIETRPGWMAWRYRARPTARHPSCAPDRSPDRRPSEIVEQLIEHRFLVHRPAADPHGRNQVRVDGGRGRSPSKPLSRDPVRRRRGLVRERVVAPAQGAETGPQPGRDAYAAPLEV